MGETSEPASVAASPATEEQPLVKSPLARGETLLSSGWRSHPDDRRVFKCNSTTPEHQSPTRRRRWRRRQQQQRARCGGSTGGDDIFIWWPGEAS